MSVLKVVTEYPGVVGVTPRIINILTNDVASAVTATGYLNHYVQAYGQQVFSPYQMALVYTTNQGPAWYQVSISNGNTSLVPYVPANFVIAQSANIGGAGAGPIVVSVPGASSTSVAVANIVSSSNAVQIQKVLPGTNQISVTFSGDPGASAIISYIVSL